MSKMNHSKGVEGSAVIVVMTQAMLVCIRACFHFLTYSEEQCIHINDKCKYLFRGVAWLKQVCDVIPQSHPYAYPTRQPQSL